jgi:octaprenyl-diphosphate synthase
MAKPHAWIDLHPLGAQEMSATAFFNRALGDHATELLAQIAEDVAAVEHELHAQTASEVKLVENVGRHTLAAGGKRLRPAFVSLAAKATLRPYVKERTVRLGACMEMIHMATLIHDDVIDNATTRRGRDTASTAFGATGSILAGDALLSKAMVILAIDGDLDIIRNVAQSVVEMAEGEAAEVATRDQFDLDEGKHLRILHMKTAAFIQSCCEIGAIVGGATPSERESLKTYGFQVGMAFQIIDDLLDYQGVKEKTGKPWATDFREGCATLPLIALRKTLSPEEHAYVASKFGNGVVDEDIAKIHQWMTDRGCFQSARAMAESHVSRAGEALNPLQGSEAKDLLLAAAEFTLQRDA